MHASNAWTRIDRANILRFLSSQFYQQLSSWLIREESFFSVLRQVISSFFNGVYFKTLLACLSSDISSRRTVSLNPISGTISRRLNVGHLCSLYDHYVILRISVSIHLAIWIQPLWMDMFHWHILTSGVRYLVNEIPQPLETGLLNVLEYLTLKSTSRLYWALFDQPKSNHDVIIGTRHSGESLTHRETCQDPLQRYAANYGGTLLIPKQSTKNLSWLFFLQNSNLYALI